MGQFYLKIKQLDQEIREIIEWNFKKQKRFWAWSADRENKFGLGTKVLYFIEEIKW